MPDDPVPTAKRAPALPPDERRAAIIAAAIPLLQRAGRRVTTREIADAAGIAEGTIFRVFETKDDLIHAVVEQEMDVTDTVDAILAIDGFQPLPDRIRACVTIVSTRLQSVFEILMALHPRGWPESGADKGSAEKGSAEGGSADKSSAEKSRAAHRLHRARTAHEARHAKLLDAIATVFEPSGALLSCSPHRAAALLRILAFSSAHPLIAGDEHLTADEITDVLLHGITRPATPSDTRTGS